MTHLEAQRWDERYQRERELWLELEPRQLLTDYAHLLPTEGRALDAASGVAIHALFLAQRGLKAFALDISEIQVDRAYGDILIAEDGSINLGRAALGKQVVSEEELEKQNTEV